MKCTVLLRAHPVPEVRKCNSDVVRNRAAVRCCVRQPYMIKRGGRNGFGIEGEGRTKVFFGS